MSKVLVIYDSKTGFTERMAEMVVEGVEGVEGVEVEAHKVGSPFSISKLNSSDAIILGSPTRYGDVTLEMRYFIDTVRSLSEGNWLNLSGKLGGVFASYEWDGGWVAERMRAEMEYMGIKMAAAEVSLADGMGGSHGIQIDEDSLERCQELGRVIAERVSDSA